MRREIYNHKQPCIFILSHFNFSVCWQPQFERIDEQPYIENSGCFFYHLLPRKMVRKERDVSAAD